MDQNANLLMEEQSLGLYYVTLNIKLKFVKLGKQLELVLMEQDVVLFMQNQVLKNLTTLLQCLYI